MHHANLKRISCCLSRNFAELTSNSQQFPVMPTSCNLTKIVMKMALNFLTSYRHAHIMHFLHGMSMAVTC
ncbi:hypothetical protein Y032_0026g1490 [Ancylostoma ceylanicum]|uniref:Uncharacterized protein n=1 Tax=Ancylostoma ceylanicum TaxID=53326 RepID=A0A016UU62_9BILA|nr:hypothetical protein Y032_0026g1490 [Ancylostoma ceylanicum]